MTGFGAGLAETDDYRVSVEVKAVNQRYLDLDVRAPHVLDPFLEAMKSKVKLNLLLQNGKSLFVRNMGIGQH